jgi:hypothetical protein
MTVITRICWELIRELLGTSWSEEGADVAVGEGSLRKEPSHKKEMLQAQPSEERNGEAPLGYSGQTALRREQCGVYDEALPGNDPTSEA